jgi:2-polyprenyl-3-methyl-5-hydroxy-6-metoxy-1,4-benzoquinol methylase
MVTQCRTVSWLEAIGYHREMKLPEASEDPTWSRLRAHDIEELWDHSIAPHVAAAYRARIELISDLVEKLAGPAGRVLDVGCAQGTLGLTLAERGIRVSLLDIRPENIAYARSRFERGPLDFHVGILSDVCPPDSNYDVVVCTEVLEHVRTPAHFLRNLAAKLRRGGVLVLTTPNADYLLTRLPTFGRASQAVIDEAEPNSLDGDAHRYLYSREELIALVRGVGLRVLRHGFFLPAWLEGHLKTRVLHRLYFRVRRQIVHLSPELPPILGRRFCSSQYLVVQRDAGLDNDLGR